jgi:site-specific recombinase XerD
MLDFYFDSSVRKRQLRRGPLTDHLDQLATAFQRSCYSRLTARRHLSIIGQLSRYLGLRGLSPGDIDETVVNAFLADAGIGEQGMGAEPAAIGLLLRHLRAQGVIAEAPATAEHPFAQTLHRYDLHLQQVLGRSHSTRRSSVAAARIFIDWLRQRHGERALLSLVGSDVLEFVAERVSRYPSRSSRGHACSQVRGFLKYLHASGTLATDWTRAVPHVSTPRLASVPRALAWEAVRAMIDGIDTSHSDGIRDKAILLLLATLGLRSGELRGLELRDLQWRTGEIRLPRTKTRRERVLPLSQELGAALADYILHGRPALPMPQIFLRHGPSPGPLLANTVIWIVRRHARRAGIQRPRMGAHMLRHSLATRMVNAGVPIKSVADVLGHASIDTTAIYTKLDMATLLTVALPFPGGAA